MIAFLIIVRRKKTLQTLFLFSLVGVLFSNHLLHASEIATVLTMKGTIEFMIPETSCSGKCLRLDGQTLKLIEVKRGGKLKPGTWIKTASDGNLKLILSQGDQISVGPSSVFYYESRKSDKDSATLNVLYGKMRATLSSTGPNNNARVRTPTGVAGVRGTDFFVSQALSEGLEVNVVRGQVAVQKTEATAPVIVQSGQKAEISAIEVNKEIQVLQTSKQDLVELAILSKSVALSDSERKELPEELKQLETVAVKAVIEDIKKYDPKQAELLQQDMTAQLNLDSIAQTVVVEAAKVAPSRAADIQKLSPRQIEDLGKDVYKEFFE